MYRLIRPILFALDAELVHRLAMGLLGFVLRFGLLRALFRRRYRVRCTVLEQSLWGINFDNPVGLGAGFDKNAEHFNALATLGFGFVEIGTVTGLAQDGNPRPRLFRFPKDRALLNRMGFNNEGADVVAARLRGCEVETLLGVNIGKSKLVALEDAALDYEASFRALYDYGRYFVVNVSSPNTPGLRQLQEREPLEQLLGRLQALNTDLGRERGCDPRPLLLKISPDITDEALDDILDVVKRCKLDGIVATNTTLDRGGLRAPAQADDLGSGGLSGRPVRERSLALIRKIYQRTEGRLPIIGVGGIFTADDALQTLEAGASLIQVWTGFVYEGPATARRINRGLIRLCDERGYAHISEAVGTRSAPLQLEA
ncbi:MAG: quinone-dependent dihydroorotate dehydrogenase [Bradymonadaceae bacterium]|nr:quinone-dependent dihydroorotate dehydrogenase [Lujinxingiaceae bacterium]